MAAKRVLVTGASGLLGRAIIKKFSQTDWELMGTAYSRADKYGLIKMDLTNEKEMNDQINKFKPTIIIHSAAQRSPNEVEDNFEAARKLNVDTTQNIGKAAEIIGASVIYISTDYVFDGNNPPYKETDVPKPVNKYGITKLEGEKVLLETSPESVILRVPVLYGDIEYIAESAVTVLLDSLLKSEKPQKVNDYEIRWPANVDDIAAICYELAERKLKDSTIAGIYQWSGKESMTKYKMVQVMAEKLCLPMNHIQADAEPNKSVNRPYNCQLDTSRLEQLGISPHTPFDQGIVKSLQRFVPKS